MNVNFVRTDRSFHISNEDLEALRSLQSHFQQCVVSFPSVFTLVFLVVGGIVFKFVRFDFQVHSKFLKYKQGWNLGSGWIHKMEFSLVEVKLDTIPELVIWIRIELTFNRNLQFVFQAAYCLSLVCLVCIKLIFELKVIFPNLHCSFQQISIPSGSYLSLLSDDSSMAMARCKIVSHSKKVQRATFVWGCESKLATLNTISAGGIHPKWERLSWHRPSLF